MNRQAIIDAYKNIDSSGAPLEYCSVCGTRVEPYPLGTFSSSEFYERGTPSEPAPSDLYHCPTCDCDRVAMSLSEDATPCAKCVRPIPMGNPHCAWCGDEVGS